MLYFLFKLSNGVAMDFALARHNMVEGQIKTNRVTDPYVIDAMSAIPREAFVKSAQKGHAYIDSAIEVAKGRFLMEPMVFARMLESAEIKPSDLVLVVGCATGYSAAVLAKIANTVVALEADDDLANAASSKLNELGCDNVVVVTGNHADGYAKQGPYDVIIFDGAVDALPDTVKSQLADGGRLVVTTNTNGVNSKVSVHTRKDEIFAQRELLETKLALLPGFEKEAGFSF